MKVENLLSIVFKVSLNFSVYSRGENVVGLSFDNEEDSIKCEEELIKYKDELEVNRVKSDVIVKIK